MNAFATVVIIECVLTSIQTAQPPAVSYLIKEPQKTITLASYFTQQPNCGFSLSASLLSSVPSFVSLDEMNQTNMLFLGTNLAEAIAYNITMVATLNG